MSEVIPIHTGAQWPGPQRLRLGVSAGYGRRAGRIPPDDDPDPMPPNAQALRGVLLQTVIDCKGVAA